MTQQEFNSKYKNWIEEKFEGLSFDIPECTEFLDEMLEYIIRNQPDFKLKQIKVKFNWYCFYSNLPKEMENKICLKLAEIHPL